MADLHPFWISWYGLRSASGPWPWEYHGPWWVSGYRCSDEAPTICAAVMARDEDHARYIIQACHDDPSVAEDIEWRFVERMADDWQPETNDNARFRRAAWMQWPWPTEKSNA